METTGQFRSRREFGVDLVLARTQRIETVAPVRVAMGESIHLPREANLDTLERTSRRLGRHGDGEAVLIQRDAAEDRPTR